MKVSPAVYLALLCIICFAGCKKNNPTPITPVVYSNYSALKVGNYWIYEEYSLDTLGNATATGRIDSCFISKDTVINSLTYFVMAGPEPMPGGGDTIYQYLRNSLDYTVDNLGNILCSSKHFGTVFNTINNSSDTITSQMADSGLIVTVPAGTFATIDFLQTYKIAPQFSHGGNPRYRRTRYAQNIGIVSEDLEFFFYPSTYTERRLVRYHLN